MPWGESRSLNPSGLLSQLGSHSRRESSCFASKHYPRSHLRGNVIEGSIAVFAGVAVVLGEGSYFVWVEGANMDCDARIVNPLEMLTMVKVTEAFGLTPK